MDDRTFDGLARSVAGADTTRRGFLAGIGGSAFAALLIRFGWEGAEAKKKRKKKKCKRSQKRCGRRCIPKRQCCKSCSACATCVAGRCVSTCQGGKTCQNGICVCPSGSTVCGDVCIPANACCSDGEAGCPYMWACQEGTCTNCIDEQCEVDADCCTRSCFHGGVSRCVCWVGNNGPAGGCTSDAQCCNGSCNLTTSQCACDPDGTPCFIAAACCSGNCVSGFCAP